MPAEQERRIRALEQEVKTLTDRNDLLEKTIHGLQDDIKDMLAGLRRKYPT